MKIRLKHHILLSAVAGVLAAMAIVTVMRLSLITTAENSVDAFYHLRISTEGWPVYGADTFPAASMSLWSKCFADKELGYHFLIQQVQRAADWFGVPEFPFHAPSLFFLLILACAFAVLCVRLKIRYAVLLIPLFFLLDYTYLNRIMMLRPHTLSIALMLLSCAAFYRIRRWQDCWLAVISGFLFVWCYSNPHFVFFPAGVIAFCKFFRHRKAAMILLLGVCAGLLSGVLLHPQFPNILVNWKVQCIDVPLLAFLGGNGLIPFGGELMISGWKVPLNLKFNSLLFLLNLAGLFCLVRQKGLSRVLANQVLTSLSLMAVLTFIGAILTFRVIEYAVPFNVILAGYVLTSLRLPRNPVLRRHWRVLVPTAGLLVLTSLLVYDAYKISTIRPLEARRLTELPAVVRRQLPPGTIIGNLFWSDFPQLYYALPEYRFLNGLDPGFAFIQNQERSVRLELFLRGRVLMSLDDVIRDAGTPYIYINEGCESWGNYFQREGASVLYHGAEGWLLDLRK